MNVVEQGMNVIANNSVNCMVGSRNELSFISVVVIVGAILLLVVLFSILFSEIKEKKGCVELNPQEEKQ